MKINNKILQLLKNRGYETEEELNEFLSSSPQKTYDPFLLNNMEAGMDLILSAVENDERICIYGDYDADGVTSVCLLMDVLGELTNKVSYYIPSRFDEGYGLNKDAIKKIYEAGASLIVTVDCGSVSYNEVEYGKSLGLKFVVTDHHKVSDTRADCIVINPSLIENTYPFQGLAGVGVAFKLAQALVETVGLDKSILVRNMDLVAIGTIGDVVPLIDENRTLVKYGLKVLKLNKRLGLSALLNILNIPALEITSEKIAFSIVPPINASGRMKNAYGASKLLLIKDENRAKDLAKNLIRQNTDRKEKQKEIFDNCIIKIENNGADKDHLIFVKIEDGHEGISGIVAGRLKDKYKKPVIIATKSEEGMYKGTGRSIGELNLYDVLASCKTLFEGFGGHKAACGFSIKEENLEELISGISKYMDDIVSQNRSILEQESKADIESANLQELDEIVECQKILEPFGNLNRKPIIEVNVRPFNFRNIGKNGEFFAFSGRLKDGNKIDFICFRNVKELQAKVECSAELDIKGTMDFNYFRDEKTIQMIIDN